MALTQLVDDLPAELQQAMQDKGLTISQAAGAAGVRREDVEEWLAGTARPTAVQLQDLAADLGVNVADLYQRSEPGYTRHSKPGQPVAMRDYLQTQDAKQAEQQSELKNLRMWFEQNQGKPGALVGQDGKAAVKRLAELERKLEGKTTVPAAILAWLGLEHE